MADDGASKPRGSRTREMPASKAETESAVPAASIGWSRNMSHSTRAQSLDGQVSSGERERIEDGDMHVRDGRLHLGD
jgi:hypothetical protein